MVGTLGLIVKVDPLMFIGSNNKKQQHQISNTVWQHSLNTSARAVDTQ